MVLALFIRLVNESNCVCLVGNPSSSEYLVVVYIFASLFIRSFCIIIIFPFIFDLEFFLFIVTIKCFYYSLIIRC